MRADENILISVDDDPRQPQAIADRQHSHYCERLTQPLFSLIGKPEIRQNRPYAEHRVGGHDDQEEHFEHENDGIAQVRHHIREITQPSFGDEVEAEH